MKLIGRTFAAILFAVVAALTTASTASAAQSPLGFKIFCLKSPAQCAATSSATLTLDDSLMSTLKGVNGSVNRSIHPRNDARGKDVWTLNAKYGDCEDYAITKRARLVAMGIPAGALRIAYAKTRRGEGHAVLVVITNRGNYVLDNRTGAIKPMSQTGLRFISMSGANPKMWASL
jgi:predicted transglutaminase-like cysteine proteinase